jgi:hypothetical protein
MAAMFRRRESGTGHRRGNLLDRDGRHFPDSRDAVIIGDGAV